jgi:hypothetical protein
MGSFKASSSVGDGNVRHCKAILFVPLPLMVLVLYYYLINYMEHNTYSKADGRLLVKICLAFKKLEASLSYNSPPMELIRKQLK